jgi:UDP-4-amino-4-deoxy-L-arabinose formyltransferase/UDP-glucuronic acid dehydrogenase (UDP-4-keto-hexauronic acid decarboxylating)
MRIAIIGRTEILYNAAVQLKQAGHDISCILTAKEAPEYTRTAADFKALAEQWSIPFAQGPRIVEHLDFLKASDSEIAASINYTGVVPQEVIDIFPLGILNAHAGDLPRYRGNACQAWAILNGEDRIGLCIHRMIGGELDSGDIIARDYLPINLSTKVTQAWNWMVERGPALMLYAVDRLARDPNYLLERQSKNPADALRCYPRRPEDGRIDWNRPAINVLRLINASNKPYAGAFCVFDGKYLIIWDAELVEDGEIFCAVPGQVTKIGDGFVEVACGVGKIRIRQAEVEGVTQMPRRWIGSIRERLT